MSTLNPFEPIKKSEKNASNQSGGTIDTTSEEVKAEETVVETETTEVPEGTIKEILAYVGDDKDKAQKALEAEEAKGDDARSSLVSKLQEVIED